MCDISIILYHIMYYNIFTIEHIYENNTNQLSTVYSHTIIYSVQRILIGNSYIAMMSYC